MSLQQDIARIKLQEQQLQFDSFSADTAWEIGGRLRTAALARRVPVTFEIQLAGRTLCMGATNDAPAGQADWIRRKRNTVLRFGKSSYLVGRELEAEQQTLEARHGLTLTDFAAHGGGFPLALKGSGLVGTIVFSGLPQRDDHSVIVDVLSSYLNLSGLAFDEQP